MVKKNLTKYRKALEENLQDFPNFRCVEAQEILYHFEGLEKVGGYFIPEGEENNPDSWRVHYWNIDSKQGLEVDISQDQFEGVYKKIIVNPIGAGKLKRDLSIENDLKEIENPLYKKKMKNLIGKIEEKLDY